MLIGTIQGVNNHGSILSAVLVDDEGSSHSLYGDARCMSLFLDRVLEEAEAEGCKPFEVRVAASGPGLAEWLSLETDADLVAAEWAEA